MLVDHADAGLDGVAGRVEDVLFAVDGDGPAVGVVEAGEDIHQRGLARAVFAKEGVDFAFAHGEGDVLVGNDAWEGLGYISHIEGDGCVVHASDCPCGVWFGQWTLAFAG